MESEKLASLLALHSLKLKPKLNSLAFLFVHSKSILHIIKNIFIYSFHKKMENLPAEINIVR